MDKDHLLCRLLGCGIFDLNMLSKMNIDIDGVLDYIIDNLNIQTRISFTDILYSSIQITLIEVENMINDKKDEVIEYINTDIEELKCQSDNENYYDKIDELEWVLETISNLNIFDDVNEYYNYIDTHVTLINNIEIYQKYFQEELDYFKNITNISLL